METEESITTNVKVSDAEIDNLVGRGIIRVLRYVGYFVYHVADILVPMLFYCGIFMLTMFNTQFIYGGVDFVDHTRFYIWAIYTLIGIVWILLKKINVFENLAKWLKIDEV